MIICEGIGGLIVGGLTLGVTVTGGLVAWLVKIEKNNVENKNQNEKMKEFKLELDRIDERVRSTEKEIVEIRNDISYIKRDTSAILTILDRRRERGED